MNDEGQCIDADGLCEGEVTYGPDPYAHDVYGDETPVWLCERHADDRAMEI